MSKGKKRSDSQKAKQKARTRQNKIKKYTKLIEAKPSDPQASIWKTKLQQLG